MGRALALEFEVWPEKHPDRIRRHVINDLNNLGLDRILFAVSDDGKRSTNRRLRVRHRNAEGPRVGANHARDESSVAVGTTRRQNKG